MRRLILTLVLALVWPVLSGSWSGLNLLLGLGIAALCTALIRHQLEQPRPMRLRWKVLLLVAVFLKELGLSAWRVTVLVLTPKMHLTPGIFALPLTVDRDFEITLLANLITLTPGTLTVDVSTDRKTLYVHALDCSDPDAAIRDIKQGFERLILEAFR